MSVHIDRTRGGMPVLLVIKQNNSIASFMIYSNFAYDVMFEFRMLKGCSRALEWYNSKALGYSILFYYTLPSNLDLDLDGFVVCARSGDMAEL